MVLLIKAMMVISISHFFAYFVLSRLTHHKDQLKLYFKAATLIIGVIVLLKPPILSFIVIVIIVRYFIRKLKPEEQIAFYFAILFSFTLTTGYFLSIGVPIGGVNYLTLITCTILIPLLFKKSKKIRLNNIDKLVITFFICQLILNLRDDSFTNGLRKDFWLTVSYIVPYFAIRKYIGNFSLVYAALGFALLSQMSVAVMEGLLSWKLYPSIEGFSGFHVNSYNPYYYRNGFLRVNAVFGNPLIISLFANFGVLYSYILLRTKDQNTPETYSRWLALGALFVSMAATFFTGSRAGLMGIVVTIALYHVFTWAAKKRSDPIPMISLVAMVAVSIYIANNQKFIEEEFGYRYQLFVVSKDVIIDNFILGDAHALRDPRMQVLVQGEGIIDPVNSYVYFSLFYGVPATLCLMIALGAGVYRSYCVIRREEHDKYILAMFCSCSLAVLMFNIATTSPSGWIYLWIWYLLPICAAIVAKSQEQARQQRVKNRNLYEA